MHTPTGQILHFSFLLSLTLSFFFFFWHEMLDFIFKTRPIRLSRNTSSAGVCPENSGQPWGCCKWETLRGVPRVISFRTWNQTGILLYQGPVPFLKEKVHFVFPQIRMHLVVGPLCMEESRRNNCPFNYSLKIPIRTQVEKFLTV